MDEVTENRWRRQRRRALAYLYVAAVCSGVLYGFIGVKEELGPDFALRSQLLIGILCSLGSLWFCTADAKLAGRPLIQLAKVGIFLFWPAGVPVYLLSVRGFRGLRVLLLHGVLLLLVGVCSVVVTVVLLALGEELFA
jgi:uncharacterized membrane protein YhaH (DUF805 family)